MSATTRPVSVRARRQVRAALIGLTLLATLAGCAQHRARQPLNKLPPPSGVPSTEPLVPPAPVDATYRADVEITIAASLHTTATGIAQQLRGRPNSTLLILAKPAGLAQDQLAAIITSALISATNDALHSGQLDAVRGATLTQYWTTQLTPDLITEASYWYLHDSAGPGVSG